MTTRQFKRTAICLGVMGLWLALATPAFAARSVSIALNPTTSSGGVNASINGVVATYHYTVYDGQSVSDTIPLQVCMTAAAADWTSLGVTLGNVSGPLPGVTLPGTQTFLNASAKPDCRNLTITVASGALTLTDPSVSQNFNAHFNASDTAPVPGTGSMKPQADFAGPKNFHIQVTVLPSISNVSCFLTDSEGLFLNDCAGNAVTESGSSEGRFAIVANRKQQQVATNPGQFYYNLVWFNSTGATQVVNVDLNKVGFNTKGAQAIHVAVFNGYLEPLTVEAFETANDDGIPAGSGSSVSGISVPAGSSLLVTYHLAWSGVGTAVQPECAGTCAQANQQAYVEGVVSGESISTETCRATAFGYLKQ